MENHLPEGNVPCVILPLPRSINVTNRYSQMNTRKHPCIPFLFYSFPILVSILASTCFQHKRRSIETPRKGTSRQCNEQVENIMTNILAKNNNQLAFNRAIISPCQLSRWKTAMSHTNKIFKLSSYQSRYHSIHMNQNHLQLKIHLSHFTV